MSWRRVVAAVVAASVSACSSSGSGSDRFFDGHATIHTAGWDMQLAKISPDGSRVAVIAVDPSGSWVIGLADKGHINAVNLDLKGKVAQDLAWMPDSHRILVADNVIGGTSTTQIECVDTAGGTCSGPAIPGAWHHSNRAGMDVSPDGKTLAIQGHPGGPDNDDGKPGLIYLVALSAPALTPLPGDVGRSRQSPVWLDATHLACVVGDTATVGSPPGRGRLSSYAIGSSGDGVPVSADDLAVGSAGPSPSGAIYFASASGAGPDKTGVYVYTSGSTKPRYLGDYKGDHPDMSGGGGYFLYAADHTQDQDAVVSAIQVNG